MMRFVEESARLLSSQVSPEVAGELRRLVEGAQLLAAPPEVREFTFAELGCEVPSAVAGAWMGDADAWRALLAEARRLGESLSLTLSEGSVRLVVGGYRPEASVGALMLRFLAERLGGKLFATESALAITVPVERPDGYVEQVQAVGNSSNAVQFTRFEFTEPCAGGQLSAADLVAEAGAELNGAGRVVAAGIGRLRALQAERNAAAGAELAVEAGRAGHNAAAPRTAATSRPARSSAPAVQGSRVLDQLAAAGDWMAVIQAADELLKSSPHNLHVLQHLALAHVRRQDWSRAFPVLRRLVGGYFAADDLDSARPLLRLMLTELPDAETGVHLAEDCLAQGELALAESYFQAAADLLVRGGDLRGAVEALRRLQVVKPDDLALAQSLGELFVRLGDHQQAVATFRGILRTRPSHRGALGALDQLARLNNDAELAELVRRRLLRPVSRVG